MNTVSYNLRHLLLALVALAGAVWLATGGSKPELSRGVSHYAVPEVGVAEARALIEAGAMVIDVRGKEAHENRHVPSAILIPLAVLRAGIPASLSAAKERPIVVYCNDGVTTGPEATHILRQAGYTQVVNLKPGIEGWAGAGLPLQKG